MKYYLPQVFAILLVGVLVAPAATFADDSTQIASSTVAAVQSPITLTGTLTLLTIDDFATGNSQDKYQLVTSNGTYDFQPQSSASVPALNSPVTVTGDIQGNTLIQTPGGTASPMVSEPTLNAVKTTGNQKILYVPVKFSSTSGTLPTPSNLTKVINAQLQQFYANQSNGNLILSGKVLPWVTVAGSNTAGCGTITLNTPEVKQAILNAGVNLNQYRNVDILFSSSDWGGGCSYIGPVPASFNGANYSLGESWLGIDSSITNVTTDPYSWNNDLSIIAHETGHTLGLEHANGLDCGKNAFYGTCSHVEYGNYYDVMGFTGDYTQGFNAYYRQQLGWESANTLAISQSGTYTVNTLEDASGSQFASIKNPALTTLGVYDTPLYVEFRQPVGYDTPTSDAPKIDFNGLMFNKIVPNSIVPYTHFIDASPTKAVWRTDVQDGVLTPGNTLADIGNGISVTVLSVNNASNAASSTVTFHVDLSAPQCKDLAPIVDMTNSIIGNTLNAGQPSALTVAASDPNYAGCGVSTYSVKAQLPSGWTFTPNSQFNNLKVLPDGSTSLNGSVTPASTTPAGTYTYTLLVTDNTSNMKAKIPVTVTVIAPVHITQLTPTKGAAGKTVHVFGTGFSATSNFIAFYTSDGSGFWSAFLPSSDTSSSTPGIREITFNFPTTMTNNSTGNPMNTPPGDYTFGVGSEDSHTDSDNQVTFTVTGSKRYATSTDPIADPDPTATDTPVLPDPIITPISTPIATTTEPVDTDPTTTPPIAAVPPTKKHHKDAAEEVAS